MSSHNGFEPLTAHAQGPRRCLMLTAEHHSSYAWTCTAFNLEQAPVDAQGRFVLAVKEHLLGNIPAGRAVDVHCLRPLTAFLPKSAWTLRFQR